MDMHASITMHKYSRTKILYKYMFEPRGDKYGPLQTNQSASARNNFQAPRNVVAPCDPIAILLGITVATAIPIILTLKEVSEELLYVAEST